jgi:hypothetical protein
MSFYSDGHSILTFHSRNDIFGREGKMKKLLFSGVVIATAMILMFGQGMASVSKPGSAAHPQEEIRIYSFIKGTSAYVLSFALTDLLKKQSSWLRATAISTHGSGENLKTLALKPALRGKSMAFSPALLPYRALKGNEPFTKPWPTVRALIKWSGGTNGYITLNPKIKKPEDLKGKKIGLPRQGSDGAYFAVNILKYGWGITEKDANYQFLGWRESRDALRDGLVDAAYMLTGSASSKPWLMVPLFQQLVATKPPYFIDISKETIEKAAKLSGDPMSWVKGPPNIYGSNQTEAVGLLALQLCYWVDLSMPDDVVKEILRIYADYSKDFGKYHPAGRLIRPKEFGRIPWPENLFHPAAVEFYKSRGIPIGLK